MNLINKNPNGEFDINIDFDDASKQWRENKIYVGNGEFRYKCCYVSIKNVGCSNQSQPYSQLCKTHNKTSKRKVIESEYNTRSKKAK